MSYNAPILPQTGSCNDPSPFAKPSVMYSDLALDHVISSLMQMTNQAAYAWPTHGLRMGTVLSSVIEEQLNVYHRMGIFVAPRL